MFLLATGQYREDSLLPAQRIGFALSKARKLVTAEVDFALEGTGVSSSHIGALWLLSRGIAYSSAELSRLLCVNPATVTRVVDRLVRQRLVRRVRNSLDRRVVNLTLTEGGRQLAAQIPEIESAMLNQRLSHFTPLEFETLCQLLRKLLEE